MNFEVGLTRDRGPGRESPHARAGKKDAGSTAKSGPAVELANEDRRYGEGLRSGDRHYRAYVGPPEVYDLIGGVQVSLLLAAGLRETHRLVDVGCGSLRAGRMFIPYLRPGHYFGVEPNQWLVEEGIKHELGDDIVEVKRPTFRFVDDFSLGAFGVSFDFALAHSVFSHTYPDLTVAGLRGIAEALAPEGKLFATFVEREWISEGSGWRYPGTVEYPWPKMQDMVVESGLVARRLDWTHPRQSWFIVAHLGAEGEIDDLSRRLRSPLQRPKTDAPASMAPTKSLEDTLD